MSTRIDTIIDEMITGAMDAVEPTAITRKLYERAQANHRKQARRVLEKAALHEVCDALATAQAELTAAEQTKSEHDAAAAEVRRLSEVIGDLRLRHTNAVTAMRASLGTSDQEAAASAVTQLDLLTRTAEDEYAAALDRLQAAYFDAETHDELTERVADLKRAASSGAAALQYQAVAYSRKLGVQAQYFGHLAHGVAESLKGRPLTAEEFAAQKVAELTNTFAMAAAGNDGKIPGAPTLNEAGA